ncbi:hypothetical protein JQC91_00265 [Jannaschia sp. Os4]|uniref:hypothetical protein n=1 Tax=Jannaschia sp. Os4 TaxID=2807617 RepID=UPI001939786A|nr:hypothetical protein [Jannaschia sp. Os4]MBM2574723.1 hypothetical protein [Jannaschia sp. Os4]
MDPLRLLDPLRPAPPTADVPAMTGATRLSEGAPLDRLSDRDRRDAGLPVEGEVAPRRLA